MADKKTQNKFSEIKFTYARAELLHNGINQLSKLDYPKSSFDFQLNIAEIREILTTFFKPFNEARNKATEPFIAKDDQGNKIADVDEKGNRGWKLKDAPKYHEMIDSMMSEECTVELPVLKMSDLKKVTGINPDIIYKLLPVISKT